MRHWEPPADLILIGHVGFATDRTPHGSETYIGGSGFAAASAAAALLDGVGLVAQVGTDFDLDILRALSVDTQGTVVLPGPSATFFIDQFRDGSIAFSSELGVAAEPNFDSFPESYLRAKYAHLATAPPRQQLAWMKFLHDKGCRAQISVDMFEPFVKADPEDCREACGKADFIFLNEAEYRGLYDGQTRPSAPTILKRGARGAKFLGDGADVDALSVEEVDPIGAGEILAGAFLALRARGLPENQALSYAVGVATRSVTELGVSGRAVTRELERVRDELDS